MFLVVTDVEVVPVDSEAQCVPYDRCGGSAGGQGGSQAGPSGPGHGDSHGAFQEAAARYYRERIPQVRVWWSKVIERVYNNAAGGDRESF